MNYPSPRGSSVTTTTTNKPSSIKQNEYQFKNLTNLDSLKVPLVKDPQANTLVEAAGSKAPLNSFRTRELQNLSECLEDESQNVMKTQLYRRNLDSFNNKTQKKLKTFARREQDVSDCSAIESLPGMSASSNDVARMIGEKRFWKMRTNMIKYVSSHLLFSVSFLMTPCS